MKRISHNYGAQAMELFLQHAFGDAERSNTMLEFQSYFYQPSWSSLCGKPALPFQEYANWVSGSADSVGRDRSRSLKVVSTMGAAALPRRLVWPHDHIGLLTIAGLQGLYIVHSDTDGQELWANAREIGKQLGQLVYIDHDVTSDLRDSVHVALSGNQFANYHFMCTKVGDFVAVGIGGKKRCRERSSRIAAAVCHELQANSSTLSDYYPALGSLIEQVRSCCNFDVR